jgi:hypothetical protein
MIRLSSMQHRSRIPSQVRGILRFIGRANDHVFNLSIGGLKAKPDDEAACGNQVEMSLEAQSETVSQAG